MKDTVKIFICGDFVAKEPEKFNLSSKVRDLMDDCDIRICNFEAPVWNNNSPAVKSGPTLFQSPKTPELLEDMGFNVILVGNNHMMDYGSQGCLDTLLLFKKAIMVGAGKSSDAYNVKVIIVKGKRIGFFCGCQYEFGVAKYDSEGIGVAWINTPEMPDIIRKAKSEVDYLIILPHAGLEDYDAPLPGWRTLYRKFIDWGADAVIAGHTHCPQGNEYYRGAPIVYSLGNFYFDALTGNGHWWDGLVAVLMIDENVSLKVYNTRFQQGLVDFNDKDSIKQHNIYLQELIENEGAYNQYIDEMCVKAYPLCQYGLLRGVCGTSRSMDFKRKIRLFVHRLLNHYDFATYLNTVRCETHRWVIERYLNIKLYNNHGRE